MSERDLAGYLLAAYTNLLDGTRYTPACSECHCEECLASMTKRGCCGLGRALRSASLRFAKRPSRGGRTP